MKRLVIFTAFILSSTLAHAITQTQALSCKNRDFQWFSADLDTSSYTTGSGFFSVQNALITNGFAQARLLCTGHSPKEEINCVGFWFDSGSLIVQVKVAPKAMGWVLNARNLNPSPVAEAVDWPCRVENQER